MRGAQRELTLRKALAYVEKELKIKEKADWHRVTRGQLDELRVAHFFDRLGGIKSVVERYV